MRVAILGAGNWGTTLGLALLACGHDVTLWEFDRAQLENVLRERENRKFLPGFPLPESLHITGDLDGATAGAEVVLLAVPAQTCRGVLRELAVLKRRMLLISLVKGIERESLYPVSEICLQELHDLPPASYAVLSGPTIACEVARGLPTSAVVASVSRQTATLIQTEFSTPRLRLYTSSDVIGVELAGALKNVIALAAGLCDGMGLGFNAKGALVTRGLAEITRLGVAMGGNRQTFSGLSGMGDLVTTCTSPHSRNRMIGELIGKGLTLEQALSRTVMVAEGVWTARAARDLASRHHVDMPITEAVCDVIEGRKNPHDAVTDLMLRNLKPED